MERMHAARVGLGYAELETSQGQFLVGVRQMADGGGDQAADSVVFVVGKIGAETFVEVGNGSQRVHHVATIGMRGNLVGAFFCIVVLIVDFADDLLQHVL